MERTRAALKAEGFGDLSEMDIPSACKEKLGREFRCSAILGACNPPLAWNALAASIEVGFRLPRNVNVEVGPDGTTLVRLIDPIQMLAQAGGTENPEIKTVAQQARERLERAARELGAG